MAPAPECPDKQGLTADIRLALNTIIGLANRQIEAVMAGDLAKIQALQADLLEVREWKDSLIESYQAHLQEHGC